MERGFATACIKHSIKNISHRSKLKPITRKKQTIFNVELCEILATNRVNQSQKTDCENCIHQFIGQSNLHFPALDI